MQLDNLEVLRLKVVAEAVPGMLVRILELLQSCDVIPLRVLAQRVAIRSRHAEVLEIEIEVSAANLDPEVFRVVAAKINQLSTVLTAVDGA
jgi:hypothetical protein